MLLTCLTLLNHENCDLPVLNGLMGFHWGGGVFIRYHLQRIMSDLFIDSLMYPNSPGDIINKLIIIISYFDVLYPIG